MSSLVRGSSGGKMYLISEKLMHSVQSRDRRNLLLSRTLGRQGPKQSVVESYESF